MSLDNVSMRLRSPEEIEALETNILTYENPDADPKSKRVLVSADNPGAFNAMQHIVRALMHDSRCSGVVALMSGKAMENFDKECPGFTHVRDEETRPDGSKRLKGIFEELGDLSEKHPFDVALVSISAKDGPETSLLFAGKGVFGKKGFLGFGRMKTYMYVDAWGGPGGAFKLPTDQMEKMDGIFCNDNLAKGIIHRAYPNFPEQRIQALGSPVAEHIDPSRVKENREKARQELKISSDSFVVFYIGDRARDYEGHSIYNPNSNIETFEKTTDVLKTWAQKEKNRNRKIAFITRPHPRDEEKARFERVVRATANDMPPNIQIVFATDTDGERDRRLFGLCADAANVVAGIIPTDVQMAPLRGSNGIYLAFPERGLGKDIQLQIWGPLVGSVETERIKIVSSAGGLERAFDAFLQETSYGSSASSAGATAGIVETILR
ncbi:MAG: hypothetical protein G01um10148_313 [Parcubacteria group bacterium Gr01-1014_8]|nr:MAG: hypothetical protein G01um10148_313 [Parcubacteria group bacterium Gr01-1014_8]